VQPASAYLMVALTHVLIKDKKPEWPNSALYSWWNVAVVDHSC